MEKTKKEIREIMGRHLCWKSLAYCCKGRCASKEACMKELGMKAEDLVNLKKDFDNKLFMKLKGGKN